MRVILSCLLGLSIGLNLLFWWLLSSTKNTVSNTETSTIYTTERAPERHNQDTQHALIHASNSHSSPTSRVTDNTETYLANTKAPSSQYTQQHTLIDNNSEFGLLVTQANAFFLTYEFYSAFNLYVDVLAQNESTALELKQQWINELAAWTQQGQITRVIEGLGVALEYFPYDESFSSMLAKAHVQLGNYPKATALYYDLSLYVNDSSASTLWQLQARQLADQHLQTLKLKGDWATMLSWLDSLRFLDPTYIEYDVLLAFSFIQAAQFTDAEHLIEQLARTEGMADHVNKLRRLLALATHENIPIKLAKSGHHFIVNAEINQVYDMNFMIDTGASLTVVTQKSFDRINLLTELTQLGHADMNTAGGVQPAMIYEVAEFNIDGITVNNLQIAVIDIPNFGGAEGLLGMNFLSQFQFTIDQEKALLWLESTQKH